MTLILLFILPGAHLSAETWRMHPAFDNDAVKIVDTPEYTFFHVFQKFYRSNKATYDKPVATGLVRIKQYPDQGFIPLSDWASVSPVSVAAVEYCPEGRFLALLHTDGGLDIVSDSGKVVYNADSKKNIFPGSGILRSMTLSGTEIWIATGSGYMVVDGMTGKTLAIRNMNRDISRIARCGDRIVLLCGQTLYDYSGKDYPGSLEDFRKIPDIYPGNPRLFLPLEGSRFLYIGDKVSDGSFSINGANLTDGRWETNHVEDLWLSSLNDVMMICNPFERNFIRNRDGWLLFTDGAARQLSFTAATTSPEFITFVPTFSAADPTLSRSITHFGSWDLASGWTYSPRGRFATARNQNGHFLIDDAEALRPNLPAVAHSTSLGYSPEHGVVGVTYGASWIFNNLEAVLPSLLSVYDGKNWTLAGPEYNKPRSAQSDPEYDRLYNTFPSYFPAGNLKGVSVDPVNSDYVWLGSTYSGIAAISLSDPGADPLHFGAPSDFLAGYPGFKALLPLQESWTQYAVLTPPSFDSNGTLWTATHDLDSQRSGGKTVKLYYWTARDRSKVLESRDVSDAAFSGSVSLPVPTTNSNFLCLALRHPASVNIVLMLTPSSPPMITRFNHHGNPEEESDNEYDAIRYIEDSNGGRWEIHNEFYTIAEDPVSGTVWVADKHGLLGFDPTGEVKDGVIKGEVLDITTGEYAGNPLAQIGVYGIAFDNLNRMWLSTKEDGIWCISADRKEVLARYTTENSLLPSDTAYGIVWNPATGSLMISTAEGYAELWPDATGPVYSSDSPVSVSPREVLPGYGGKIWVRGAFPNSEIEVTAPDGSKVAVLKSDSNGTAIWDAADADGHRLPSGIYTLRGNFGKVDVAIVK